jgi:hypothetical protein
MRTKLNSKRRWPRWLLTVPTLVALTALAAGAVLASAVDATFFLFAAPIGLAVIVLVTLGRDAWSSRRRATISAAPALKAGGDCPSFIALPAHARADEFSRVLFTQQTYFPVTQGREVVGVISKGRLLSALAHGQGDRLIAELMNETGSSRPMLVS